MSTKRKVKYVYKTMWFNPKNEKTEMIAYSQSYDLLEDAKKWYEKYGKKLEKMFNRKLFLKCIGESASEKNI
jgi:hypothetical protein